MCFESILSLSGALSFAAKWLFPTKFFVSLAQASPPESLLHGIPNSGPLAWWFVVCFIVNWALRYGSIASKLAMIGCAALGFGMVSLTENLYQHADFTERRLNVSPPAFEPGLLILAGTVKPLNYPAPESTFEIRIAGRDYYHLHQSWPDTWEYQESRYTEIATPNSAGWVGSYPRRRNMLFAIHCGPRPTAIEIFGEPTLLMPGRGLWSGTGFTGATNEGQRVEYVPLKTNYRLTGRHEKYSRLERIGRWQVPREIIFHDPARVFGTYVYTVRRVELLALPEREWFDQVKAKLLPPGQSRWNLRDGTLTYRVREDSAPKPPAPPPGR